MQAEIMTGESATRTPFSHSKDLQLAYTVSGILAGLVACISIVGLRFPGVYRGNWGNGTSLGNDLVTLVVAVPLLVLSLLYSIRGSSRARLLWLGALYYLIYNYAFYVFGLPVTKLYVPIIGAFVLSGVAFVLGVRNLDLDLLGSRFTPRGWTKLIAAYLMWVAVMICFLWISLWVRFLRTGQVPDVNGSEYAYQVIAAVDLSLMVPVQVSAAYLLWRRRALGCLLSAVALVQGAIYTAVMVIVCVFGWKLTPGSQLFSDWLIKCSIGCVLCVVGLAVLLLSVNSPREEQRFNS